MTSEAAVFGVLVLAGLGLVSVWTSGTRIGRRVARSASVAARATVTALVLTAVQWAVLAHTTNAAVWAAVLGAPAMFAGVSLARLVTPPAVRTGRWRVGDRR